MDDVNIEGMCYIYYQKYYVIHSSAWSWGSSVSEVTDYRLDNWGSILGRGKIFFL
jgi:hypothetical protein